MEVVSKKANVILLYKDNVPEVMVLPNGMTKHFKLGEMSVKDYEEFYETDKASHE